MALVLCTAGAMAQTTTKTIRFTFARTGTGLTDIPVTVTVNDAASTEVGGQAVLGRQNISPTPWLTERHGYDPTCRQPQKQLDSHSHVPEQDSLIFL